MCIRDRLPTFARERTDGVLNVGCFLENCVSGKLDLSDDVVVWVAEEFDEVTESRGGVDAGVVEPTKRFPKENVFYLGEAPIEGC